MDARMMKLDLCADEWFLNATNPMPNAIRKYLMDRFATAIKHMHGVDVFDIIDRVEYKIQRHFTGENATARWEAVREFSAIKYVVKTATRVVQDRLQHADTARVTYVGDLLEMYEQTGDVDLATVPAFTPSSEVVRVVRKTIRRLHRQGHRDEARLLLIIVWYVFVGDSGVSTEISESDIPPTSVTRATKPKSQRGKLMAYVTKKISWTPKHYKNVRLQLQRLTQDLKGYLKP